MFLQVLETLGVFFGGLGALLGATTQLLTFLKKKEEEVGRSGGSAPDWMAFPRPAAQLIAAA
ncbi:hypothetical protein FM076_15125 [Streptomyces albus subsp. chlorinus]|uniref:hypothetical protein n=1 Tax=Streptomyces albus TaxID=1888 RepID=UPI00156F050A|nr:hypothetical protein [Streptomyces albus]NSC22442.1 hypothetical protein [Streptomyces albus subsp. chlorinus]